MLYDKLLINSFFRTVLFEYFECIKNIKCVLAGNFLLVIPRCSRTDLVLSRQKLHRKDA